MSLTLTYFGFDGSRGLECRLALTAAGIPFTDERLDREAWGARKAATPFGGVPVLTDGARTLSQSNAILTWVGRTGGLHPQDLWTAAEHEAIMDSVEELRAKMPSPSTDDEKRTAREAFGAGWLTQWAGTIAGRIRGPFLEGDTLSVADLKLYVIQRSFQRNAYDHLPGTFFNAWPAILAHYAAVEAHPVVAAYWAAHP